MPAPTLTVDGPVATLTLQRPAQANRLEPEDLAALTAHVEAVDADPAVRVLLLRAGGRHFCSGFDIGRVGGARVGDFEAMVDRVEAARPVTIAVIQGGVYGGATDLALACASASARRRPTSSCRRRAWACTSTVAASSATSRGWVWTWPSGCS